MNMSSNRRLAIPFESVSPKKTAWKLKLRFMTKKKRTVITEESHEVWIIRNPNDQTSGDVGESANASPAVIPRDQIVSGSSEADSDLLDIDDD